jgi:hypothetical protein
VLIRDGGIPAHLGRSRHRSAGLFPSQGESHLDPVARLDEPECVDAVVREHRPLRRIDVQTRGGGEREVTVGDAAAPERIARRLRFIHA